MTIRDICTDTTWKYPVQNVKKNYSKKIESHEPSGNLHDHDWKYPDQNIKRNFFAKKFVIVHIPRRLTTFYFFRIIFLTFWSGYFQVVSVQISRMVMASSRRKLVNFDEYRANTRWNHGDALIFPWRGVRGRGKADYGVPVKRLTQHGKPRPRVKNKSFLAGASYFSFFSGLQLWRSYLFSIY